MVLYKYMFLSKLIEQLPQQYEFECMYILKFE